MHRVAGETLVASHSNINVHEVKICTMFVSGKGLISVVALMVCDIPVLSSNKCRLAVSSDQLI
jgi:hypothetical protein